MKKITILLAIICLLDSCNAKKPLHKSGPYIIESREKNMTKFEGVRGTYAIISDTLKAGDTIQIIMMKRKN